MLAVYQQLSKCAKDLEVDTSRFLSDMVRVPSFSGKEKKGCQVIMKEMEATGFDEVRLDGLGSVVCRIGSGPSVIAFDAQIVVSVDNGVILGGLNKGFLDLQWASLIERLPRLIRVQAKSSDSIHRYLQTGFFSDAANPVTRTDSISVTCPSNAHGACRAILENAGLTLTTDRQGDPIRPIPDGPLDRHLPRAGHGLKDVEGPPSLINITPAIDPVLEEMPR